MLMMLTDCFVEHWKNFSSDDLVLNFMMITDWIEEDANFFEQCMVKSWPWPNVCEFVLKKFWVYKNCWNFVKLGRNFVVDFERKWIFKQFCEAWPNECCTWLNFENWGMHVNFRINLEVFKIMHVTLVIKGWINSRLMLIIWGKW